MSDAYYHTKESVDEYIKMAEGYNGLALIAHLKRFLPADSLLLELGSGPGSDFEMLCTHYNVVGSDHSDEFLIRLKSKYPSGEFLKLDAATLQTVKKFDGIYSNKVLHHLKTENLKTSITRQHNVLNPGGIVCHSFWKGEGCESFKGMFVNNHTQSELRGMFEPTFEIVFLELYEEFEKDDSLLIIAKKKKTAKQQGHKSAR